METKKSVSDFQFEYGEFQLQYGEFREEIRLKTAGKGLKNTEKAGLPAWRSRLAVTKIIYFPSESK